MQTNDLFHDLRTNEEIYKQLHNQTAEMDSLDSTFGPGGKFCVSVFRQNQEYHIINVHDGAYSPWLHPSRKVGAVCAPRAA